MKSLPNVYPIHDQVLVRELPYESLLEIGFIPSNEPVRRGSIVRVGLGVPTRFGPIEPIVKVGDDVLFMLNMAMKFEHEGEIFYLLSEWNTSGVLNRDPSIYLEAEPLVGFPGVDIDALMDRIEAEETAAKPRDPDGSDTQD
jgi:co-chaperonin GroES (HSP10)